jgi:hypothetical protein
MNDNGPGPTTRPSPVPLLPLKQLMVPADAMVLKIVRLRDLAQCAGLIQLTHALARIEAKRLAGQARRGRAEQDADSRSRGPEQSQ